MNNYGIMKSESLDNSLVEELVELPSNSSVGDFRMVLQLWSYFIKQPERG